MDWKNHLEKKRFQKIEKKCKHQSETAACEQKTTSEKSNFGSYTVSHYTLNLEQKNLRRKTTRFFAPLPVSA